MVVSIRLPNDSNLPHHYANTSRRPKVSIFSSRIRRRILIVTVFVVLCIEIYSFISTSRKQFLQPITDLDLPPPNPLSKSLKTLIVVACHSIWLGGPTLGQSAAEWTLEPYQLAASAPASFLSHITAGIAAAQSDQFALLVFSGGETRPSAGPLSEATSYYALALAHNLLAGDIRNRTTTETAATDSYQNLVFSLARFREFTGGIYPHKLVVVSFGFKHERFRDLHSSAIGWPQDEDRFEFLGVGDPVDSNELLQSKQGEEKTKILWEKDPYGCLTQGLRAKRRTRNWGRRTVAYELSCPELRGLLRICSQRRRPSELLQELPWSKKTEPIGERFMGFRTSMYSQQGRIHGKQAPESLGFSSRAETNNR